MAQNSNFRYHVFSKKKIVVGLLANFEVDTFKTVGEAEFENTQHK